METLIAIFEKESIHEELIVDGSWNDIINQIDGFKMRISNIVNLQMNTDRIHSLLDNAVNTKSIEFKIRNLKECKFILQKSINEYTQEYLESENLYNPNLFDYLL